MEIKQATWSFFASGFLLFVNGDWLRNIQYGPCGFSTAEFRGC
jgi:hypothetical protein